MGTAVIASGVMIHVQPHDTAPLFDSFEVKPQTEYLLPFFQRETDIRFAIPYFCFYISR